ncbi:chondroitin sulfate synthase 2 isoform X1 [Anabrus simplex]|uniref:chondroitin sulfate synthase 2 isoform X1 n=1 Tax=Anabrus simplex TaxID=316456 RepID=UPI0035A36F0F
MKTTMFRCFYAHCRQNTYFIIGLCIGISISLLMTPILDNDCLFNKAHSFESDHFTKGRSLNSESESDEYKPVINLAGKPQKALKTPQILMRPRYYSTELGIREKLFVGVLTSPTTLESRAVGLNKTVAHLVDKLMFFIDAPGPQKLNISMPGIVGFSDSRKILKPFHMLKYITDNHMGDFDFFFLVKDSTYIKARRLYEIVQDISVSEDVHAGSGKDDEHTAFCSLDAGLLLSNSVMQKVSSSLDWCVKNAFSDLDDANIGRCVLHATGIPCQDSVQGQQLTSFTLSENFNIYQDLYKLSEEAKLRAALSLYPVLNLADVFKLHSYFSKVSLVEAKQDISLLRKFIANASVSSPVRSLQLSPVSWPIGTQRGNIPVSRFDILRWDYFTNKEFCLDSDFSNSKKLRGADKLDIEYVLNATIAKIESVTNGQLQFRRLIDGYRKFDPSRGLDYQIEMAFKDTSTGHEVLKRLEVFKPLGKVEVIPMPYVTENNRINLVLPVEAVTRDQAKHFMEQYARICMEKRDKTFLMLVLLYDPTVPGKGNKDDVFLDVKQMALALSDRHKKDGNKIAWVSIKVPTRTEHGSLLEFAIADIVVKKFSPDSLVLLCQPNMEIRQDFLNRVRMNTIQEWQVFSPIPFSEFHPSIVYSTSFPRPLELDINKNYGHYDSHHTGHIAFYTKDYSTVRKLVEDIILPVNTDRDINLLLATKQKNFNGKCFLHDLYSMFVCTGKLHVLRAVEPGLRLRFRECVCPPSSGSPYEYQQCIDSRANNLGFRNQLAHLILDYQAQQLQKASM